MDKGLSRDLAIDVARELTAHDALGAHAEVELGIDPNDLTNPWHAAFASMIAFTFGALIPLAFMVFSSDGARLWLTVSAVVVALGLAGWISARLGSSPPGRAVLRNIGGGLLAMGVTYLIGSLVGSQL